VDFSTTKENRVTRSKVSETIARVRTGCGPISYMMNTEVNTFVNLLSLPRGRMWDRRDNVKNEVSNLSILHQG
jgi:hypothetical protein